MVSKYSFITLDQLQALAALANSKTALQFGGPFGRPYNFADPQNPFSDADPSWRTELMRLRVNLFREFQFYDYTPLNYSALNKPYLAEAIVSGPWTLTPNNFTPGTTALNDEVDGLFIRSRVPNVGELKFAAVRNSLNSVTTKLTLFENTAFYWSPAEDQVVYRSNVLPKRPYEFHAVLTADFEFTFQLNILARVRNGGATNTLALFGANAGDCTLTIQSIEPVIGGERNVFATISCAPFTTGTFDWEVGVYDTTETAAQNVRFIQLWPDLAADKLNIGKVVRTSAARIAFPVIDNQTDGYAIAGESLAANKIFSQAADADEILLRDGIKFIGNQANLTCEIDGDLQRGVWIGQTLPIAEMKIRNEFNPFAQFTCEYMLPSYPVIRYDQALPAAAYAFNAPVDISGAQIISIFVGRQGVEAADGMVNPPTIRPEITVEIGRYSTTLGFRAFDSITIVAGELSAQKTVLYLANALFGDSGNQFRLVYRASEPLDVQAIFAAASPAVGLGIGAGVPVLGNLIISDFYNDTEALLNLLS